MSPLNRTLIAAVVFGLSVFSTSPSMAASGNSRRQSRSIASPAPATTPTAVVAAPIATTSVDVVQSPMANVSNAGARRSPLNWDAFIDVQAVIPSKESVYDKGVTLNDAALYLAKDFSRASVIVDLPFFTRLPGSTGNVFAFAQQKAQAYVQLNYGAFGLRLGQYDSFFGLEANDSIARFFADQGLMKALGIDPLTHSGAQLILSANKFTFRAQVANPNGAGTMGSGPGGGGGDPEVGAQARFDASNAYLAVGGEYGTYRTVGDDKTNYLVEIMGGLSLNRFNLGAQIDWRKLSGVSAAGINQTYSGSGQAGWGLGLLGSFEATDTLSIGARLDYINQINTAVAPIIGTGRDGVLYEDGFLLSVGPSYKLEKDLTVRADLSALRLKTYANGDNDTNFGLSFSLVARL